MELPILIGTPARDSVLATFTFDLVNLLEHQKTKNVKWSTAQGTILPNLRAELAKTSINFGYSHLLFIDSDMRFPVDTLDKLLAHDLDIVGVNCKQRTQDEWTARKDGMFISPEGKTGIEEVDTIGMGVTLIKTEVFKKMPVPWFATPFDGKEMKHVGEDVYFCEMARHSGFKTYVDHDLAYFVKHTGVVELGM